MRPRAGAGPTLLVGGWRPAVGRDGTGPLSFVAQGPRFIRRWSALA